MEFEKTKLSHFNDNWKQRSKKGLQLLSHAVEYYGFVK